MRLGPKSTTGLGAPGALRPHTPRKGGGFSLAAFMAAQSDGFWYDFGQTDRLFQEPNGPTPANDPNEVIGLALSSRLWGGKSLAAYLAVHPELRSNSTPAMVGSATPATFDASTGNGTVSRTDVSNQSVIRTTGLSAGRTYSVSFTNSGSAQIVWRNSDGTPFQLVAAGATASFFFVPTTTRFDIGASTNGTTASFTGLTIKEVSRYPATQATGTLKPKFQTTGAAFDGSDDNLLTGYTAGAGANFLVAKVTVPASIEATQILLGSSDAGGSNALRIGVTASGVVRGAVGTDLLIDGLSDVRGQTVVVGLSCDGSAVRLFVGSAIEVQRAQAGAPTTTQPFRLGSQNSGGSAANFFAGSIKAVVAGRQFLDLSTFNKIAAAL